MKHNVIIIGLGNIGLMYDLIVPNKKICKTHSKSLFYSKKYNLIGAVEKDRISKKKFISKYKLPVFDNLSFPLNFYKPDFVIIAVPTKNHLKIFNKIIKHVSVKYILFEKPVGNNIHECREIIKKSNKKNIKVYVNYIRNYQTKIIDFFYSNKFFKITNKNLVTIYYTGSILNNCSHFFALLISLYNFKNIKNFKLLKFLNDKPKNFYFEIKKSKFFFINVSRIDKRINTINISSQDIEINFNSSNELITVYNKITKNINKIKTGMDKYQLNVYKEIAFDINNNSKYVCKVSIAYETHKIIAKINNASKEI